MITEQKGVSRLLLLVAITILVLGSSGYIYFQSKNHKDSEIKIEADSNNWVPYINKNLGFQFQYPRNLNRINEIGSDDKNFLSVVVLPVSDVEDRVPNFSVRVEKAVPSTSLLEYANLGDELVSSEEVIINGDKWLKVKFNDGRLDKYVMYAIQHDKLFVIVYDYNNPIFDKIAASIDFIADNGKGSKEVSYPASHFLESTEIKNGEVAKIYFLHTLPQVSYYKVKISCAQDLLNVQVISSSASGNLCNKENTVASTSDFFDFKYMGVDKGKDMHSSIRVESFDGREYQIGNTRYDVVNVVSRMAENTNSGVEKINEYEKARSSVKQYLDKEINFYYPEKWTVSTSTKLITLFDSKGRKAIQVYPVDSGIPDPRPKIGDPIYYYDSNSKSLTISKYSENSQEIINSSINVKEEIYTYSMSPIFKISKPSHSNIVLYSPYGFDVLNALDPRYNDLLDAITQTVSYHPEGEIAQSHQNWLAPLLIQISKLSEDF